MKAKTEIEQIIKQEILSRTEIRFAYIFGSFTGTGSFRDVDLGIYLADVVDAERQNYDIQLAISLERTIGLPVDVVVMNSAPDHLIHRISSGHLVLDRVPDDRADFLAAAWARYFDIRPKREAYLREKVMVQ